MVADALAVGRLPSEDFVRSRDNPGSTLFTLMPSPRDLALLEAGWDRLKPDAFAMPRDQYTMLLPRPR